MGGPDRVKKVKWGSMLEAVSFSDKSPDRDVELHAGSRVALIMGIERVAEEASRVHSPASVSTELVRAIIEARNARKRFFGEQLFADPAWDILLELYVLRCDQRRASVSKLSLGAGVPTTTALRWIEKLHSDGLVEREPDPLDARRVWVALSDQGFQAMQSYVRAIGYLAG